MTGTVTATVIVIQRRWSDRDLEARRLKLIEAARSQIQAVEPLWNSPERAGTPDVTRERAYTIIISALDSLLRAQALTDAEEHRHDRSFLRDLLLLRHFDTLGARMLRVIYYFWFLQLSFFVVILIGGVAGEKTADIPAVIAGSFVFIGTMAVPSLIFRSWALAHERRHAPAPPSPYVPDPDTPAPPGPQYPIAGPPYSQPPYNPSVYSEQSVHPGPPGEHQPPN
jgi:hypothetical protein